MKLLMLYIYLIQRNKFNKIFNKKNWDKNKIEIIFNIFYYIM